MSQGDNTGLAKGNSVSVGAESLVDNQAETQSRVHKELCDKPCKSEKLSQILLQRSLKLSQQRLDSWVVNDSVTNCANPLRKCDTLSNLSCELESIDSRSVAASDLYVSADESLEEDNLSRKSPTCESQQRMEIVMQQLENTISSRCQMLSVASTSLSVAQPSERVLHKENNSMRQVKGSATAEETSFTPATTTAITQNAEMGLNQLQENHSSLSVNMDDNWSQLEEMIQAAVSQSVQSSIESLRQEWKKDVESAQCNIIKDMNLVKVKNSKIESNLLATDTQITVCKKHVEELEGVAMRQDQIIRECKREIQQLQLQASKLNLFIYGLIKQDKENCKDVVKNFFKDVLKIDTDISIKSAYRKGKGKQGPVFVMLSNVADKSKIYSNVKKLKDATNSLGKAYRIEDDLPSEIREVRRRNRQIIAINKNRQQHDQLSVKYEEGKLVVDDVVYKKQLVPPSCQQLLRPNIERITAQKDIQITQGKVIEVGSSKFTGLSAIIRSLEEANDAYAKVCAMYPDARQVTAAVRLPHTNFHTHQDFNDDGEHGAGPVLLKVLEESKMFNRIVLVVRQYHDGVHIGKQRFTAMVDEAKDALKRAPYNHV